MQGGAGGGGGEVSAQVLYEAAQRGIPFVKKLCDRAGPGFNVDAPDLHGNTALLLATNDRNIACAKVRAGRFRCC
jgi:hypothetical protein